MNTKLNKQHSWEEDGRIKQACDLSVEAFSLRCNFTANSETSKLLFSSAYSLAISAFALKGFVSYKGVIACKAANDSADGLNFFRRFIVLSVPVGVSLTIVYIVVVFALAFILPAFHQYLGDESSLLVLFAIVDIGYTAIFFVYLSKAFSKLNAGYV